MAQSARDITTHRYDTTVDELLRRIIIDLDDRGLEVDAVIDHSGNAYEAGLEMPDTKLLLFGRPELATQLMLAHPSIALDLPLSLLIAERSESHAASVSYTAPGRLAKRHGLTDNEADGLRVVDAIARAAGGA
jgi:uncharacterized protein (DUF302 family)